MFDKRGGKMLNIHQVIIILITFIIDFPTEKHHALHNYG